MMHDDVWRFNGSTAQRLNGSTDLGQLRLPLLLGLLLVLGRWVGGWSQVAWGEPRAAIARGVGLQRVVGGDGHRLERREVSSHAIMVKCYYLGRDGLLARQRRDAASEGRQGEVNLDALLRAGALGARGLEPLRAGEVY